jgi:biopolymer transport protein ExbD
MHIDLGEEEQPEIGLVAMIDCIFFLLMFFMLATTFKHQENMKKEKELPVALPKAQASLERAGAATDALVIAVARNGQLFIDGRPASKQQLHLHLASAAARDPQQRVRIDGDEQTPYQHIVHVIDLCQLNGLTNIAMHTRD